MLLVMEVDHDLDEVREQYPWRTRATGELVFESVWAYFENTRRLECCRKFKRRRTSTISNAGDEHPLVFEVRGAWRQDDAACWLSMGGHGRETNKHYQLLVYFGCPAWFVKWAENLFGQYNIVWPHFFNLAIFFMFLHTCLHGLWFIVSTAFLNSRMRHSGMIPPFRPFWPLNFKRP